MSFSIVRVKGRKMSMFYKPFLSNSLNIPLLVNYRLYVFPLHVFFSFIQYYTTSSRCSPLFIHSIHVSSQIGKSISMITCFTLKLTITFLPTFVCNSNTYKLVVLKKSYLPYPKHLTWFAHFKTTLWWSSILGLHWIENAHIYGKNCLQGYTLPMFSFISQEPSVQNYF